MFILPRPKEDQQLLDIFRKLPIHVKNQLLHLRCHVSQELARRFLAPYRCCKVEELFANYNQNKQHFELGIILTHPVRLDFKHYNVYITYLGNASKNHVRLVCGNATRIPDIKAE